MIAGWLAAAAVAGLDLAVVDGPLRPGRVATLEVAVTGPGGAPAVVPPRVVVQGASVRGPDLDRPGVWRYRLVPATDADRVEVRAGEVQRVWTSEPPPASSLELPPVVDAWVRSGPVKFLIRGEPGLAPDALEVRVGEGVVSDVRGGPDGGIEVELELDDQPLPRFVLVGVRDRRRDERPAFTQVRLRARPHLPLQAEPGSTLTLSMGSRTWGPFVADAAGQLEARIEQGPGEHAVAALLVDDLGNETRTEIPLLAQVSPSLLVFPDGELLPGRPPPMVTLRAVDADGGVPDRPPTCRTPSAGLPLRPVGPGTWVLAVPDGENPEDVRLVCTLGTTSVDTRVPVASGVPSGLGLRVWPEELRADFPVAEVRVQLEDLRGERLPVDTVRVRADRGEVVMQASTGIVGQGEYSGEAAIGAGEDRILASYEAPRGEGPVEELLLRWGPPAGGRVPVHARAVDALRRPLVGIPLTLSTERSSVEAVSGSDGWASAELDLPRGDAPVLVRAASTFRERTALVLPQDQGTAGPGVPELVEVRRVVLRPGRVTGISVEVEPATLRAAPGATAWVYVKLEDGTGQPVLDEPVVVETSEGTVGELHARADGTWVAEYTPLPVEQGREVTITARTATVRSSARLVLEPRVVRFSLGPWVGAQTNFGSLYSPVVGVDLDIRTRSPLFGESLMVRFGLHGTAFRSVSDLGAGRTAELRSSVLPFSGALLLRDDRGSWSLWGGGGGAIAVHRLQARFGDQLVSSGDRLLLGPVVLGAVSRRALGGEVLLTVRATWLPATREEVGYTGNLGGLAGGLGYRLVW